MANHGFLTKVSPCYTLSPAMILKLLQKVSNLEVQRFGRLFQKTDGLDLASTYTYVVLTVNQRLDRRNCECVPLPSTGVLQTSFLYTKNCALVV